METTVKLNELDAILAELEYPIAREAVARECRDVTLQLADGEENLAAVVEQSSDMRFDSVDDLGSEVRSLLPQHAVGEPYQSEGEG